MKNLLISGLLLIASTLQSQEWKTDLEDALREAVVQDRKVLLFFSVPDACDACVRLENTVLKSDAFKAYANENYVLARIEFTNSPGFTLSEEQKAKNLLIVEKYNKDGFFPLVVVLSKNAQVLGKSGVYNDETPAEYIRILNSIDR